ncbi:MAG: TldD/PmbA family protein [Candidatus Thorarchaeota archaeon]
MKKALDSFADKAVVFADIRQETQRSTNLTVVNSNLREFNETNKAGAVARVLVGECWGQASTTLPLSEDRFKTLLEQALKRAKSSAKYSRKIIDFSGITPYVKTVHQEVKEDPSNVSGEEKLKFVVELDKSQQIDERIVNTNSYYADQKKQYRLVNTAGSQIEWDEIRTLMFVQSVAKEGDKVQFDYDVHGGRGGYEIAREVNTEKVGSRCAKGAIELLSAGKPPSGELTVVIDGEISGLVAHEVCGHASEADEVVKGRSFLTGLVGDNVGTEYVTMIDDGNLNEWGGIPFDSEGTPASRTVIIEKGEFMGYLHSLETSILMGVEPTGNGRAQDYNRRVFARMTNTFFDVGDWKEEEIIEDTKDGLYVIKATSGMEDVVGGGVQASALKGYNIKNGEKTELVRSMTLAGKVLDILKTVDAVSDKIKYSGGTCGKGEEDLVSVSTGGPHMRAQIIVGGG